MEKMLYLSYEWKILRQVAGNELESKKEKKKKNKSRLSYKIKNGFPSATWSSHVKFSQHP